MTVICDSNFEKSHTAQKKTTVRFLQILCEASRGHGGSLQNHRDLGCCLEVSDGVISNMLKNLRVFVRFRQTKIGKNLCLGALKNVNFTRRF